MTKTRILLAGEVQGCAGLLGELLAAWDGSSGMTPEIALVSPSSLAADVERALDDAEGVVVAPAAWSDLRVVAEAFPRSPRIVAVGIDDADAADSGASAAWGLPVIRGRGLDGFRWALAWLRQRLEYPFEEHSYGEHPDQIADLRLPMSGEAPFPVAVFLHGGFWRERWVRDTIEPLAIDLAGRGFATLNVEYRRAGGRFGGWRETAGDVVGAIDHLDVIRDRLDLSRVVLIGHSAGAQLAAWAVKRRGIESRTWRVSPCAVVLLAGMVELEEAARRGLGDTGNPTVAFVGGSASERREDYASASPHSNLPLGVPQIIVQGMRDSPDLVDMARRYALQASKSGDEVEYLEFEGGDHFSVITPSRTEWRTTVTTMCAALDSQSASERP
jgi:acetyl esterase/lipase